MKWNFLQIFHEPGVGRLTSGRLSRGRHPLLAYFFQSVFKRKFLANLFNDNVTNHYKGFKWN